MFSNSLVGAVAAEGGARGSRDVTILSSTFRALGCESEVIGGFLLPSPKSTTLLQSYHNDTVHNYTVLAIIGPGVTTALLLRVLIPTPCY